MTTFTGLEIKPEIPIDGEDGSVEYAVNFTVLSGPAKASSFTNGTVEITGGSGLISLDALMPPSQEEWTVRADISILDRGAIRRSMPQLSLVLSWTDAHDTLQPFLYEGATNSVSLTSDANNFVIFQKLIMTNGTSATIQLNTALTDKLTLHVFDSSGNFVGGMVYDQFGSAIGFNYDFQTGNEISISGPMGGYVSYALIYNWSGLCPFVSTNSFWMGTNNTFLPVFCPSPQTVNFDLSLTSS